MKNCYSASTLMIFDLKIIDNSVENEQFVQKYQELIILIEHQNLKSPTSGQKHLKFPQFEALYKHSLPPNLHLSSCSIAWALRAQSWRPAFSSQQQQNQPKSTNYPPNS